MVTTIHVPSVAHSAGKSREGTRRQCAAKRQLVARQTGSPFYNNPSPHHSRTAENDTEGGTDNAPFPNARLDRRPAPERTADADHGRAARAGGPTGHRAGLDEDGS